MIVINFLLCLSLGLVTMFKTAKYCKLDGLSHSYH